jgi:hypothetical protein
LKKNPTKIWEASPPLPLLMPIKSYTRIYKKKTKLNQN